MNGQRKRAIKHNLSSVLTDTAELISTSELLGTIHSRVKVDSTAFQAWLETAQSFSYGRLRNYPGYIARNEKRRGNAGFWYAYKKDDSGKLHKVYIGRTVDLTAARLLDVQELLQAKMSPNDFYQQRIAEQIKRGESYGEKRLEKLKALGHPDHQEQPDQRGELDEVSPTSG